MLHRGLRLCTLSSPPAKPTISRKGLGWKMFSAECRNTNWAKRTSQIFSLGTGLLLQRKSNSNWHQTHTNTNATDTSPVPVASHFVNMYFFGCLPDKSGDACAAPVAFHKWMGNIHLHVLVCYLVERRFRHFFYLLCPSIVLSL